MRYKILLRAGGGEVAFRYVPKGSQVCGPSFQVSDFWKYLKQICDPLKGKNLEMQASLGVTMLKIFACLTSLQLVGIE